MIYWIYYGSVIMNKISPEFAKINTFNHLPRLVRKRTQELADFKIEKIELAITKAATACNVKDIGAHYLAEEVCDLILEKQYDVPTIEQIQDLVEIVLMREHPEVAQAYIRYRTLQTERRTANSTMIASIVDGYIDDSDWRVRENSNMSVSIQGLHNHISSEHSKHYALENWYSDKISNAHRSGDLHIHDLGMLAAYCVGWDLKDFLLKGFSGVKGKLISKPPKHFDTAMDQIVQFLYTTQGETSGAQALSNVDTILAPFIRADNLDYKGVLRAIRSFVFSLNIPTRVG